jgi:hypothetical protein
MSDEQQIRHEIKGTEYVLLPWSVPDGQAWMFRLARVLVAAGASGPAGLLGAISPNDWRELVDVVVKYTRVVEVVDGEELMPKLADRREHLRGRKLALALLVRKHLEAEFADFFDGLEEVFAVPAALAKGSEADAG